MCPSDSPISTASVELPDKARTITGFEFCPRDDSWLIPDQRACHVFDFSSLFSYCGNNLLQALKRTLVYYLEQKSASHSINSYFMFKQFVRYTWSNSNCLISRISSTDIINYKGKLSKETEWHLGSLRVLLKKWHALGYPGIDQNVIPLLKQLRLSGNRKGEAVLTLDPNRGPFTDIELQGIHTAINQAYAKGEISARAFVLIWLFMALGARSVQIASLKIKDFDVQRASDGSTSHLLNVPRAKQRGHIIRDQFKPRTLISDVGVALEVWIANLKSEYDGYLRITPVNSKVPYGDLPIFPKWGRLNSVGFEHHANGIDLAEEVQKPFNNLKVRSERTGNILNVTVRRFRYTLGTRAAIEGYNEFIIAELLDHTDTQNVSVYVKATPDFIDRIDKSLALSLGPYAQAFMGKIIEDGRVNGEFTPIGSPLFKKNKPFVGNCAKFGPCKAFAPIACYLCGEFYARVDGPHLEVLEVLLAERERLLEQTKDKRIASVNDRVIFAVAEVVKKCMEIIEQRKARNDGNHTICRKS